MPAIDTLIQNISNDHIFSFFQSKIGSFRREEQIFPDISYDTDAFEVPEKIGEAQLNGHESLMVFSCRSKKKLSQRSAKKKDHYNVNVLRKKGLSLFSQQSSNGQGAKVLALDFIDFLEFVSCEPQTKRLPLSDNFWPVYEKIKTHKETINRSLSPQSIESKAFDNLKVARKIIDVSEGENIAFIETLLKDIREYRTLSTYTLRRLAFKKLTPNSSKKDWSNFFKELNFIKTRFGKDYLDLLLKKVDKKEQEIIIAIENRE